MSDKLNIYFPIIDAYRMSNDFSDNVYESDEVELLSLFCPFYLSMLMKYLDNIIEPIWKNSSSKEKVNEKIEYLKSLLDSKEINPEILNNYMWKNISLVELLRGDYNFLIEKFILNPELVPNNESYINNYEFHELSIKYPFSLKELYKIFVDRGIDITIDNYYYFENQKKYILKK